MRVVDNHREDSATESGSVASVPPRVWRRRIALILLSFVLVVLVFLGIIALRVKWQAELDEARPAGAIIVFGAAEYAGRPSPVLKARLDHALELYAGGVAPLVITTGGAARDPKFSEGGVGRDYLIAHGIPDADLIAETQSSDTAESASRTANILRVNGVRDCVAVSDAYHMFRVKRLLEDQGLRVYASPRSSSIPKTRWGRTSTAMREAFSYMLWKLHLT